MVIISTIPMVWPTESNRVRVVRPSPSPLSKSNCVERDEISAIPGFAMEISAYSGVLWMFGQQGSMKR